MPAKRLPWFKLESGCTSHAKVATLTDLQFRIWVEMLDAASRQPRRGMFTSVAEAAAVTRRPARFIQTLVTARLVDVGEDGVRMHDWHEWQDRFPSDQSANAPDLLPDHSVNAPRRLRDESPERSDKKKRENKKPPTEAAPAVPNKNAQVIDAIRAQGLDPTLTKRDHAAIASSNASPADIAAVYAAVYRGEYGDQWMRQRLSVHEAIGWIDGFRATAAHPVTRGTNGRPEQQINRKDRTFEDPLTRDE